MESPCLHSLYKGSTLESHKAKSIEIIKNNCPYWFDILIIDFSKPISPLIFCILVKPHFAII